MHNIRKVAEDISWVGCNDRRLALFENLFPIPKGVSYNSYLIMDEKVVLMDTVDASATPVFKENLAHVLKGKTIDYLVVQHMEPDHCAGIEELMEEYKEMKVVANAKTVQMIHQFFNIETTERVMLVKEGETLCTGRHTLRFFMAPMVHWPEVMVTYDERDKVLFSADAFGTFGALNGAIFNDELNFERDWLADARRYYANIVGKYGMQVQSLLNKVSELDVRMLCPLHGPVWRTDVNFFIDKYQKWSKYEPEEKGIVVLYGSIYGYTEQTVNALLSKLADKGVKNLAAYDVSTVHVSEVIAEMFRCSHLVFACPTYNGGIFPPMENLLSDMKALTVQNRVAAIIENGTWAVTSGKQVAAKLQEMKRMVLLEQTLTQKSTLRQGQEEELDAFVKQLLDSIQGEC